MIGQASIVSATARHLVQAQAARAGRAAREIVAEPTRTSRHVTFAVTTSSPLAALLGFAGIAIASGELLASRRRPYNRRNPPRQLIMSVDIKVTRGGVTRRFKLPLTPTPTWSALSGLAKERHAVPAAESVALTYKDREGEDITMCV
jgi:hypothetical protein